MEAVYGLQSKEHAKLRDQESTKLRTSLVPAADVEQKKLAVALVDAWNALRALENIKGDLVKQGLGWLSIPISLETERVFTSVDRTSDLAQLLRQCADKGFINLPKGI